MATQIKKIREAVCANRGGLSGATNGQIMIIWNSLPPDVQKQYLESTGADQNRSEPTGTKKERKGADAAGDKA